MIVANNNFYHTIFNNQPYIQLHSAFDPNRVDSGINCCKDEG